MRWAAFSRPQMPTTRLTSPRPSCPRLPLPPRQNEENPSPSVLRRVARSQANNLPGDEPPGTVQSNPDPRSGHPGGRRHITGQNANGCRFTGAVRAQETHHFAPFNLEAYISDGRHRTVVFRQPSASIITLPSFQLVIGMAGEFQKSSRHVKVQLPSLAHRLGAQ